MASIPKKVFQRVRDQIKRYQPILEDARSRDINESDTVIIISDILSDLFGYDKYSEITTEQAIRGTYCDLAIKLEGDIQFLVEVKAIGMDLKDSHLRQAVNYAANQGIEWVVLTNGILWQGYRVLFEKPIEFEKVFDIDLIQSSYKDESLIGVLYLLCKDGIKKAAIEKYHKQKQATSKFFLAAIIQSDSVLGVIRRELKKLSKDVHIDINQLKIIIQNEVLKREIIQGERADEAAQQIKRVAGRLAKTKKEKSVEVIEEKTDPQGE